MEFSCTLLRGGCLWCESSPCLPPAGQMPLRGRLRALDVPADCPQVGLRLQQGRLPPFEALSAFLPGLMKGL
jgi:hypothetical protein